MVKENRRFYQRIFGRIVMLNPKVIKIMRLVY